MLLFNSFQRTGARYLTLAALVLVGIAVLTLLFPMVLAVLFAAVCFLGAAACLRLAWRIYRASGPTKNRPHIHVESHHEQEVIF